MEGLHIGMEEMKKGVGGEGRGSLQGLCELDGRQPQLPDSMLSM